MDDHTFRPEQNEWNSAKNIVKCILLKDTLHNLIQISIKFAPDVPIELELELELIYFT